MYQEIKKLHWFWKQINLEKVISEELKESIKPRKCMENWIL